MPSIEHACNWEELMATTGHKYRSEFARRYVREGEVRGEARGEAKSILKILEAHGVEVAEEERERILACTCEDTLTTWLMRALTAASVDELFR